MKKTVLLLVLVLIPAAVLTAQLQAVVKETTGKVEIKTSGSTAWVAAKAGTKLAKGSFITTGFNSTAVLELGPAVLQVKPLTRMQLEDLVASEGTVSTELFLKVGKVRAELKTTAGVKQNFTLKSAVSTAAVRGTEFEFDGLVVKVINGQVFFYNSVGQSRSVAAGEQSSTDGQQAPTSGDEELGSTTEIATSTAPTEDGAPSEPPPILNATVTIRWQ